MSSHLYPHVIPAIAQLVEHLTVDCAEIRWSLASVTSLILLHLQALSPVQLAHTAVCRGREARPVTLTHSRLADRLALRHLQNSQTQCTSELKETVENLSPPASNLTFSDGSYPEDNSREAESVSFKNSVVY